MPPAAAVAGAAGIGLVGGVISAKMQGDAAKSAAQTQADAANHSADLQYQMYQQTRDDQAPWRQAGSTALSQLQDPSFQHDFTASDFQKDPGYDFRMQEGQKALEASAASRGGLMGGNFATALSKYGQDYASNEYNNAYNRFNADRDRRFNRLSSIAGVGQTANSQVGAAGQNYANQAGNFMTSAANAAGASQIAQANAWGGAVNQGLSGIGNNWMQYQMLNRASSPSVTKIGSNAWAGSNGGSLSNIG